MHETRYRLDPPPVEAKPAPWAGLAWTAGLHGLVALTLLIVNQDLLGAWFALIGVMQLPYMLPAFFIASARSTPGVVRGLIIGMSLTFLLNALCVGVVFTLLASGAIKIGG